MTMLVFDHVITRGSRGLFHHFYAVPIWFLGICCAAVLLLLAGSGMAVEIQSEQALTAASTWLRTSRLRPMGSSYASASAAGVQSFRDLRGRILFHVIELEGGGYVVTSGDDGIAPIIAFSAKGEFLADHRHPLWTILQRDQPNRLRAAEKHRPGGTAGGPTRSGAALPDYPEQWRKLLAPTDGTRGVDEVEDLRVAPFLPSSWGQSTVAGKNVFNYYTPNNYVTGCVATAAAQLMRYHEYPWQQVTAAKVNCMVDGFSRSLEVKGGTYDWLNMPLVPDAGITDVQRQAIGKLLNDIAVSVGMNFTEDGSAASMYDLHTQLTNLFHYANSKYFVHWDDGQSISGTIHYQDMLLTNFDAGLPMVLGINGPGGGHAVVGDGYGFLSGGLYIHLQMGWDGYGDSWYNLPEIDGASFSFDLFDELIFNVFPEFQGELITGRVVDQGGLPLDGVALTAHAITSGALIAEAASNAQGIYALKIPTPSSTQTCYRIAASFRGSQARRDVDKIVSSFNYNVIDTARHDIRVQIGSRWGVDFVLNPLPYRYDVTAETVTITGFDGDPTELVIPENIEGMPVVAIAAEAFAGFANLSSVSIPGTVVTLAADAFAGCISLQSVALGRSLAYLEPSALRGCPSLLTFDVDPSNTQFATDAAGALYSKDFTALYRYPSGRSGGYSLPAGVTVIHPYAFDSCQFLTGLQLPDSLTDIGAQAFYGCATLVALEFPPSLTAIGDGAFADSTLRELIFNSAPPALGAEPFPVGTSIFFYEDIPGWSGLVEFGGCPVGLIAVYHTVIFELGEHGQAAAGALLSQDIRHGQAATAPGVLTRPRWEFTGWDLDFSQVSGPLTVTARYRYRRDIVLSAGWQMIGLDLIPDESSGARLAAEELCQVDATRRIVLKKNGFAPGNAYWLFRQAPGTVTLTGERLDSAQKPLPTTRGWQLVVAFDDYPDTLPPGVAAAWRWSNGRYIRAMQLFAGECYWLFLQ